MADTAHLPDASQWGLDPRIAHLNHGSFGATPRPVLAAQQALRDALELNPVEFLVHQLPERLAEVRRRVAAFLQADEDGLVFVDNATTGTQTVVAQTRLAAGDEVVATDHGYPAVLAQLRRAVDAAGASLRVVPVPLPPRDGSAVTSAVLAAVTSRTRLVVVDQVTSCSGLVFPVEQIAAECQRAGVPVLVDGAHAPGMLPVDLDRIGADYWVGNLHKWVCAPKAAAALYAAPHRRPDLRPLVTSHGTADGYRPAFDWTGTRDPTALLAVPHALDFFESAGWTAVRAHNNALAADGAALVADRIGTRPPDLPCELAGSMRLVPLPAPLSDAEARALERELLTAHRVVVPVTSHGGYRWLRVSAQLYNTMADYERLAVALAPG